MGITAILIMLLFIIKHLFSISVLMSIFLRYLTLFLGSAYDFLLGIIAFSFSLCLLIDPINGFLAYFGLIFFVT